MLVVPNTVPRMREERVVVGAIPARLYEPGGATGLLLLGHGGAQSKDADRFVALCRHYAASTGLAVVCIDAVDHGERRPAAVVSEGIPQGWHSRAIPQMVSDWREVADEFSAVGPACAYVGFSMGVLFGLATVASMPSISAAVFIAGGFPTGGWVDDPDLRDNLISGASRLHHAHVLMLNKNEDEMFDASKAQSLFESVSSRSKKLHFSPGGHDDWGPDLVAESVNFVRTHVRPPLPD